MNSEQLPTITIPVMTVEVMEKIIERVMRKVLGEKMEKPDESLITTEEVCKQFYVSRITINNYRKSGKLVPFSKAGRQYTYRMCDCIQAFQHRLKAL